MKITIKRDKYGNILRHLTQDGEYIREIIYQYNHQGDMISRENYDKDGVLLDRNTAHNEYDNEGNLSYTKDTFNLYDRTSKNVIRTHVTERIYDNIYDANGLLIEVTSNYLSPVIHDDLHVSTQMDKIVSYKEKFYYHNALLIKKDHINKTNNGIPIYISTYKYGEHNKIIEEQVSLENGVLSHCILYKYIEENRYCKTIVGPSRTHHCWKIDALIEAHCEITLYENCCTSELIEDVLTYILMPNFMVKDVIISLNTAEDYTHHESIEKKLREYQDIHNIWIALIP